MNPKGRAGVYGLCTPVAGSAPSRELVLSVLSPGFLGCPLWGVVCRCVHGCRRAEKIHVTRAQPLERRAGSLSVCSLLCFKHLKQLESESEVAQLCLTLCDPMD